MMSHDIAIIGGGIVGLATARHISRQFPKMTTVVLEKESRVASHQTGHNSGVIHCGIYYKPDSLRAKLCLEGSKAMFKFCDENNVPYKKVGKVIVATHQEELSRLQDLYNRGLQNNLADLRILNRKELKSIEPHCEGVQAIHCPHTGIVDYQKVSEAMGENFKQSGGTILSNFNVKSIAYDETSDFPIQIKGGDGQKFVHSKFLITCAGLNADRIAKMTGASDLPKIVPFKGEYLTIKHNRIPFCKGNIYPVPNPKFPFLGVHFTPKMDGSIWLGPNALLSLGREGYGHSPFAGFSLKDASDALTFQGFRKLALKNLAFGITETMKSNCTTWQVRDLQKYVPELKVSDVTKGGNAVGVRAQALDETGQLIEDFIFDNGSGPLRRRVLNVRNAPSPAATSSLAIARVVVEKAAEDFKLAVEPTS